MALRLSRSDAEAAELVVDLLRNKFGEVDEEELCCGACPMCVEHTLIDGWGDEHPVVLCLQELYRGGYAEPTLMDNPMCDGMFYAVMSEVALRKLGEVD